MVDRGPCACCESHVPRANRRPTCDARSRRGNCVTNALVKGLLANSYPTARPVSRMNAPPIELLQLLRPLLLEGTGHSLSLSLRLGAAPPVIPHSAAARVGSSLSLSLAHQRSFAHLRRPKFEWKLCSRGVSGDPARQTLMEFRNNRHLIHNSS
jgi:hypothetical protein